MGSKVRSVLLCLVIGAGCSGPEGPAKHAERGDEPERAAASRNAEDKAAMRDAKPPFPIEEVAKYPVPGTATPSATRFTPQGDALTYLFSPEGTLTKDLFVQELGATEPTLLFTPPEGGATEDNLSEEEKLRRERMRMRGLGVTSYGWAKEIERFLVPVRGDLWVQDGLQSEPRKVVDSEEHPALDAKLTRDGSYIAYVQDDELYVVPAEGTAPKQLTEGARGTGKTHGQAEYIAQEEMGRHTGYWWSHDGRSIAYTEVDETHIPIYRIEHQGKDAPHHEDHGYPFAGEDNARVRLGVIGRGGGRTVWMDLAATGIAPPERPDDFYLARVHWMPDGSLMAEVENREQTRLDLVRFDPKTGRGQEVLTEQTDVWINLHGIFETLEDVQGELENGFLWGSERTGFRHIYAYDAQGNEVRALTSGDWMVDALEGVDRKNGWVYFTATKDGPTQRHLYRVPLAGGEIEKLTTEPGMHGITMDRDATRYIDDFSSLEQAARITVHEADSGKQIAEVPVKPDPRIEELGLKPPELVTLQSREGTELHGAIYRPQGEGPFPTIVSVYGGPHAQRVQNSWGLTADMQAQYLRGLGYLVFKLDNRGSARRGLAFEGAIKHDMGNLEVQDQVDGVKWLVEQGLADPKRVGITGWSYGGYMSAMALVKASETFRVGVAGAPVTHWDGYDTHYTERYMGTPQGNPEGYERSSVMAHVDALEGNLLLVHGLIDENVHFRHTARLINALITARKDYDVLMFPDERHMPRREEDRVYMIERVVDYFGRHL